MFRYRNALLGATALAWTLATPALAASNPQIDANAAGASSVNPSRLAAADSNSGAAPAASGIETVVVTAERRLENVQRVPIAITAIDGSSLDKQSIAGFKELSTKVPSFRFGAGVTGGENVITMRGLGSQNTTPGGDSPVAYSVDGVTLQRSTAVDPEFYDVDRIEVLRGPQGTLYGRNSVGGSINVITNHPQDEFSAAADVLIGDYSARIFRAWATGPIVDDDGFQLLGRITGVSAEHEPYATNLSRVPGATHNQDAEDVQMIRGELLFNFSPQVNFLLTASTMDSKDPVATNVAWWQVPTRYMVPGAPADPTIPVGSRCDFSTKAKFDPRKFCHDYPENASNRVDLFTGTLNWNLGWAELTSVSGYSTSKVSQTSDGDGSDLPIAMGSAWDQHQRQLSEEVRLASDDEASSVRWLAGFIYFWADNFENFGYEDTGYNDYFTAPPFSGFLDEFNFFSHGNAKTKAWAPFGQVDFDLSKTSAGIPLTITAGVRYSHDERSGFNYLDYQLPALNLDFPSSSTFNKTWSQWTGKLAAKYQFTDDFMGYVSVARGYLSGGTIIGLAKVYNPEHVWSYEAGFKSGWFDNRLQLNAAAFHEDIANMQVFIQSAVDSAIENAGKSRVNGLELEAIALPTDNLRLNATVTLSDAKYLEYFSRDTRYGPFLAPCTILDPTDPHYGECDFKGHKLNQTPPYTVDLGAEYTINSAFGTFTPRADIFFSGEVFFTPPNNPLARQGAYHQTNLHLTWNDNNGRWWADAFVNNLEDKDVISNDGLQSISLGLGVLEPDNYAYYPPRTVGLRVGVHL
jgi:iron complex outermembrane receptor protein